MEIGGNIFGNNNRNQQQNNNNNNINDITWDASQFVTTATNTVINAALCDPNHHYYNNNGTDFHQNVRSEPSSSSSNVMCLKLGKRNYFEDTTGVTGFYTSKRNRGYGGGDGGGVDDWGNYTSNSTSAAAMLGIQATVTCQVEGCDVTLVNAKEYHRRHKVCEMHSKAPRVVVFGSEQRFCQQCSRFHAISEFDDSKRSCRRRLAGHNERRRKSSHDSLVPSPSQETKLTTGRYLPCFPSSPTERALSLLSANSNHHQPYLPQPDLSSRSSAALRELIAENRAAVLSTQLVQDRDLHWQNHTPTDLTRPQSSHRLHQLHQLYQQQPGYDRYHQGGGSHVTLNLMQAPSSAFGLLSMRGSKSKEEDAEECSELWNTLEEGAAHVS